MLWFVLVIHFYPVSVVSPHQCAGVGSILCNRILPNIDKNLIPLVSVVVALAPSVILLMYAVSGTGISGVKVRGFK